MVATCVVWQVLEKERLVEFADALRGKLNYFDELEKVKAPPRKQEFFSFC